MTGLKRFNRPGVIISVMVHLGILALSLHFLGAEVLVDKPPEPKPPDATMVEIVPPPEAKLPDAPKAEIVPPPEATPRYEGTPADAATSGTPTPVNSANATGAAQPLPPKPPAQAPQQPERPNPQPDARQTAAQPDKQAQAKADPLQMAQSDEGPLQAAHSESEQPDTAKSDTADASTSAPPPLPQPQPVDRPDQPSASETFAKLALFGGQFGGGIEAPAIPAPEVERNFATVFLERVSSCSSLPPGISLTDKVAVSVQVSFKPDGSLASPVRPLGRIATPEQLAMLQSATAALERCQPYTMLPANRYEEWKTLDLTFSPLNFAGR
jgi:hypothetical protein